MAACVMIMIIQLYVHIYKLHYSRRIIASEIKDVEERIYDIDDNSSGKRGREKMQIFFGGLAEGGEKVKERTCRCEQNRRYAGSMSYQFIIPHVWRLVSPSAYTVSVNRTRLCHSISWVHTHRCSVKARPGPMLCIHL